MLRAALLCLTLTASVAAGPRPAILEARPGLLVLNGPPTEAIYQEIHSRHITHVLDFRQDLELGAEGRLENVQVQRLGVVYMRYALPVAPEAADFVFVRGLLRSLPPGAKVLLHCSTGNRAAAAACPWLVLDQGMEAGQALAVCRRAGLSQAETDQAVNRYLQGQPKS